jgi:hypothetical protein
MAFDVGAVVGRLQLDTTDFEQNGRRAIKTSQDLAATLPRPWVEAEAASAGAHAEIGRTPGLVGAARQATQGWAGDMVKLGGSFILAQAGLFGFVQGARTLVGVVSRGVGAIDEMEAAAIRMAGTFVDIQPSLSFDRALAQAREMVAVAQRLDAVFSGTGQDLVGLLELSARFGITFDLATEKGQRGLVVLGELVSKMNPSVEFQRAAFSEIRALVEGIARPGAMIARSLEMQGVNLKEQVPLWIRQGEVAERLQAAFPGLTAQLDAQRGLLSVMRSSWQSIVTRLLQRGMLPAYRDMVGLQQTMNAALFDQNGELTRGGRIIVGLLQAGWEAVASTVKVVLPLLREMAPVLGAGLVILTGMAKAMAVVATTTRGFVGALVALSKRDFAGALEAIDAAALDIERIDLPGYFMRLAKGEAAAATEGFRLERTLVDQRAAFLKTAEGIEYLHETGQITFDAMVRRLKEVRDQTDDTTEDGAKAWFDLDRKIRKLEEDRTKKVQEETAKRAEAERRLRAAVLEATGRTLEAQLAAIEERRRKFAEEAGDAAGAERLAGLERLRALREAFDRGRALVVRGTEELLQARGEGYRAELFQTQEALRARLREVEEAERAGIVSAADAARARLEAEQTAEAKAEEVRRKAREDRRLFERAGVRALVEATKDGLREQLLTIEDAQRRQVEAVREAGRRIGASEQETQAQVTAIHQAANLQRAQAFRDAVASMRAELSRLRQAHSQALLDIVGTDIRAARLRAEIAGKSQDEVLAAEQRAIEEALRSDRLSVRDRIGLAQQLQGVVRQRLDMAREDMTLAGNQAALAAALLAARKSELALLADLRREQEEAAKTQGEALADAESRAGRLLAMVAPALKDLQTNAQGVAAAVIQSLGIEAPSEVRAAWKRAIDAIVEDMKRLDPRHRQSPSLIDRLRAGLQQAETLVADFSGGRGAPAAALAAGGMQVSGPVSIVLPSWIRTPWEARDFIRRTLQEEGASMTRRAT